VGLVKETLVFHVHETSWFKIDFLIVTAVQDEFDAVAAQLPKAPSYEEPPDALAYVPRLRSKGIYRIAIIKTGQTNAMSQAAVTDAIKRRDPRAIILTGIAAGFPESGVALGDVLIPSWIAPYEHAKIIEKRGKVDYRRRGKLIDVSPYLRESADSLKNDPTSPWARNLTAPRPENPNDLPKIHVDEKFVLGSGEKLVASEFALDRKWLIREFESNALGLEMESYGVAVACRKADKPFLVVKASQDPATVAKDTPATKDLWRRYAAAVAAKFVLTLVERYTFSNSSAAVVANAPISTREEDFWNKCHAAEQVAIRDNECAWVLPFPHPGRSPLDIEMTYDAANIRYQRYDHVVKTNTLLLNAIRDWQHENPRENQELDSEPWGRQVRLERVTVHRAHEDDRDRIVLGPTKYLYYLALHQRLIEPSLADLRAAVFQNATEMQEPLSLPSNFAIHMGVISKDRFLLLRKRQSNRRTPYSGAWEAGIGEFMHGPLSPDTPDFVDDNQPSLARFLLRAVNEELKFDEAQIRRFTVHGFALERLTLAPKLLVLYRSDATIETLMEGALRAKDYAWDVDKVRLSAEAIATTACEPYYRDWGPTSKLTMMLALSADLAPSEKSALIRNVHEIVESLHQPH
jgi:nucleoside phosphorylase